VLTTRVDPPGVRGSPDTDGEALAGRAVHVTEEYAAMAPEEIQVLADAKEADAAARYRRHQQFSALVADAIRRAEAMTRLEIQLTRPVR
jgi:hypothetical protein